MFTGIVQELGTVARIERAAGVIRLTIQAPRIASRVQRLESVAINGVCLSVIRVRHGMLTFEVIPETRRSTSVGGLRRGDCVNLEPSLTLSDRVSGHLVLGHVDGVGTVTKRSVRTGEVVLELRVPRELRALLVPKGPITIEGVSLTVGARLGRTTCRLHLIPETLRQTTLGSRAVGDRVNLEIDYVAKLIRQFVGSR